MAVYYLIDVLPITLQNMAYCITAHVFEGLARDSIFSRIFDTAKLWRALLDSTRFIYFSPLSSSTLPTSRFATMVHCKHQRIMSQMRILLISSLIPILAHAKQQKSILFLQDQRNSLRSISIRPLKATTPNSKRSPKAQTFYPDEGTCIYLRGKFSSVADFEKMIELDPTTDAPPATPVLPTTTSTTKKGMDQFSPSRICRGRENGVWKFFCEANLEELKRHNKICFLTSLRSPSLPRCL